MGDPAGVGPEILARTIVDTVANAAADTGTDSGNRFEQHGTPWVLVGTRWALHKGAECVSAQLPPLNPILSPQQAVPGWNLLTQGIPEPDDFRFGQVQASCGEIAVKAVEWAANQCLQGQLAAMVTAPINKEAIHAAGYVNDIGHQEILARLAGEPDRHHAHDAGFTGGAFIHPQILAQPYASSPRMKCWASCI